MVRLLGFANEVWVQISARPAKHSTKPLRAWILNILHKLFMIIFLRLHLLLLICPVLLPLLRLLASTAPFINASIACRR